MSSPDDDVVVAGGAKAEGGAEGRRGVASTKNFEGIVPFLDVPHM